MPKKKRAQTQRAAASAARSLSSEGSDSEELEPAPRKRARRGAVDEPCAPYITVRIYQKPDWRGPLEYKFREKIPFSKTLESVRPILINHVEEELEGLWSLEGCKLYWLCRDKHGSPSTRTNPPHSLKTEEDYRDMVKDTTLGKGGKKRRADSSDEMGLHFGILLRPEEQEPAGSERAAGTTTTKKKKPDADVYEFDDEQEDADELCPIRISKLELRLPVVQEGAQLCTVSWKGEAAVKVVASTSLSPPLMLTGESNELGKLTTEVDKLIGKLGESAETKTSHFLQQCAGEGGESAPLFWVSKARDASGGIVELASSKALLQIAPPKKKGKGARRKEFVEPRDGTLMLSKPSAGSHPFVEKAPEEGTWDSAVYSSSQKGKARERDNRPPILIPPEKRGELRDKRQASSALRGQMLAALKGMQQRAVAAECDDAVDLTPAHRSAICDLIEKGELEEVTIGTGWTESYVRELPWSSDAVDDEKTHTKRGVHLALIAALCRHSEAMRTNLDQRIPKKCQKPQQKLSALEHIAQKGLIVLQPDRQAVQEQRAVQDAPQGQSAAAAQSAAATVVGQTNQHIEALQSQQALIEKQILKLKARLQVSDDEAKDALEAKITTLEQKVEEIDDKICALL